MQIAGGLTGDVIRSLETLARTGEPVRTHAIFKIMLAKRTLINFYSNRTASTERFGNLLLDRVRPVGGISPLVYELAQTILISLATYGGLRFVGSFSSEAGKIAAQRLLEKKPEEVASELSVHIELIPLIVSEISDLSEKEELWRELKSALAKAKK